MRLTQMVGFNDYPAVRISGSAKPGYTSGDAIAEMERITATLPRGFGFEWTGQSAQEKLAGSQAPLLLGLLRRGICCLQPCTKPSTISISVSSWWCRSHAGGGGGRDAAGMPNDVYFTIGLVTIIGLAAKDGNLDHPAREAIRAKGKPAESSHGRGRPSSVSGRSS